VLLTLGGMMKITGLLRSQRIAQFGALAEVALVITQLNVGIKLLQTKIHHWLYHRKLK
jgi:hypothetical protein